MLMEYRDDVMPYKKKAKKPTIKKSKHKHIFQPCVVEYPEDWYKKPHLQSGKRKADIAYYCPVCGKRTSGLEIDRWCEKQPVDDSGIPLHIFKIEPTEECARELNPQTRSLPTFYMKDPFDKFVDVCSVKDD